jgi:hypothetical protein
MTDVIFKHSLGSKKTHNRDGKFTRCWRLLADGTIERTNSRSKYQPYFACETPPQEIFAAAKEAGITPKPGRPGKLDWRHKQRKPLAAQRRKDCGMRLTAAEAEALKNNAAAAQLTVVDFVVSRCCG